MLHAIQRRLGLYCLIPSEKNVSKLCELRTAWICIWFHLSRLFLSTVREREIKSQFLALVFVYSTYSDVLFHVSIYCHFLCLFFALIASNLNGNNPRVYFRQKWNKPPKHNLGYAEFGESILKYCPQSH